MKKNRKLTGKVTRRDFIKYAGVVGAQAAILTSGFGNVDKSWAMGKKVEKRSFIVPPASTHPDRIEIARVITEAWGKLGFETGTDVMTYSEGIRRVFTEHDYDLFLVTFAAQDIRLDPDIFLMKLHGADERKKGGWNFAHYYNPEFEKIGQAQRREMNPEKRRELVLKAQEIIYRDVPTAVILYPQDPQAYRIDNFTNWEWMVGEGISSFWTDIYVKPAKRKVRRTGTTTISKTINPLTLTAWEDFTNAQRIYDRLFRLGKDGTPVPWAAKDFILVDNTTIDIPIREGMKFHDGEAVTAEDVKFSFDYHKQWKAPFWASVLENVKEVQKLGDYKIRILLNAPNAPFKIHPLSTIFILPKHIWSKIPSKSTVEDPLKWANDNPIGSGPFKFKHWRRGEEFYVEKFEQHFSPPHVDGMIAIEYKSMEGLVGGLLKDQCDSTWWKVFPSYVDILKADPNIEVRGYPTQAILSLSFNCERPPFNDPRVRRALNLAIPRKFILDVIQRGFGEIGGSVIAPANKFWHNAKLEPDPEDMNRAKKILEEAKYTWDDKGFIHYSA
jgi:peptide/nickel transport system substrate-binding protein